MYEDKNYAQLLTDMKEDIGTGVQKGEGYLVYNALSALAYEMEKLYIQMDYLNRQSHADTADLDELVLIAKDRGIYQKSIQRIREGKSRCHGSNRNTVLFEILSLCGGRRTECGIA